MRLWSNSGAVRIGFQLDSVWQLSQGTASGPWGLRALTRSGAGRFCWGALAPGNQKNRLCNKIVRTRVTRAFRPMPAVETQMYERPWYRGGAAQVTVRRASFRPENGPVWMAKLLADLELWIAVALCTRLGCGLVEKNRPAIYVAP